MYLQETLSVSSLNNNINKSNESWDKELFWSILSLELLVNVIQRKPPNQHHI